MAFSLRAGRHTRRRFLKQQQEEALAQIALDRNHLQGDIPGTALSQDPDAFLVSRYLLFFCVVKGRAQFHG